jgi:hypothetical protein
MAGGRISSPNDRPDCCGVHATPESEDDGARWKIYLGAGTVLVDAEDQIGHLSVSVKRQLPS